MAHSIRYNAGDFETRGELGSPAASVRKSSTIPVGPTDGLGDIALRAYGHNSAEYRSLIEHANGSTDPTIVKEINAPLG